jgi:hypothetical protein
LLPPLFDRLRIRRVAVQAVLAYDHADPAKSVVVRVAGPCTGVSAIDGGAAQSWYRYTGQGLVLETELAAMAADRAEAADLTLLEDLLEQSKCSLAGEGRPFIELDLEFHLAIASCSKNKVLRQLLSDIRGVLMEWITKSQELPGLRENALVQHVSIFEAIRDRDEVRARGAMRMHLETFLRAYSLLGRIASFDGIRGRTLTLEGDSSPC